MRSTACEQCRYRSPPRPRQDDAALRNTNPPPGALVDGRTCGSAQHGTGDQGKHGYRTVATDVIGGESEHHGRPTVDQSAKHLLGGLRLDASVAHDSDAMALWNEISLRVPSATRLANVIRLGYAGPCSSRSTMSAVPAAAPSASGATTPSTSSSGDQMASAGIFNSMCELRAPYVRRAPDSRPSIHVHVCVRFCRYNRP